MNSIVQAARSFLFVPASRPERFSKALRAGAGCVVLDLEDAVGIDQKNTARLNIEKNIELFSRDELEKTLVRINPAGSPWYEEELNAISKWSAMGLGGVLLPKAERVSDIRHLAGFLSVSTAIVPLVESLAGLDSLDSLAQVPETARLAFGHLDFQLDLGMNCGANEVELNSVRFTFVAASSRAGLPSPIDGVTANTRDAEALLNDCKRARAFGFGGKLCIHPSQVETVNRALAPSEQEIEWAQRVIETLRIKGDEAFSVDGKMVDLPVIRQAEETLRQAGGDPHQGGKT